MVSPSFGQNRDALVIGNADYPGRTLVHPAKDAGAMATKLASLGFRVVKGIDLDNVELYRTVDDFVDTMAPGGVAVVYFSGICVQTEGRTYLLPVGGSPQTVSIHGLDLERVLKSLDAANRILVFLDGARPVEPGINQPMPPSGFQPAPLRNGSAVVLSAAFDEIAPDVDSRPHSPFTQSLLDHIDVPGLSVTEMIHRVAMDVHAKSGSAQRPLVWMTAGPELKLAGDAPATPGAPISPAPPVAAEVESAPVDGLARLCLLAAVAVLALGFGLWWVFRRIKT